ncbi:MULTISPECIES: carboxypeptidase-like regulatory domain-containing protein [unclassified Sphingobacterium]|uniref:carboxypeptidase-like regulatory domain-containing protein n=1 Tax=unclassified Sphingobacterium TaxID=2609468 RepID=UPI0020C3BD47|nr:MULTISPECIES: carboxypeptidase-like regulatory domain-containing protein [unclassified Sphingobacterium]
MKILVRIFILCFMLSPALLYAQQSLEGIVYDKESKRRLGEVQIRNLNTQKYIYNDARGEFKTPVHAGDVLVFKKMGYFSDTVVVNNQSALIINLKENVANIETVTVIGRKNPDDVLNEIKRDYGKAFELAKPGDLFSVGMTGAGLNINSLYGMISKEGKDARRFTQFIGKLHEENIIDFNFTPELVHSLVGLEGDDLKAFMQLFRPTYEFVSTANYYQMVKYIKSKYEVFKLHPNLRPLRELPDIQLDVKKEN